MALASNIYHRLMVTLTFMSTFDHGLMGLAWTRLQFLMDRHCYDSTYVFFCILLYKVNFKTFRIKILRTIIQYFFGESINYLINCSHVHLVAY